MTTSAVSRGASVPSQPAWSPENLGIDLGFVMFVPTQMRADIDTRQQMSTRSDSVLSIQARMPDNSITRRSMRLTPSTREHAAMTALLDAARGADLLARSTSFDPNWKPLPDTDDPANGGGVRMRFAFNGPDGDMRQVAWEILQDTELPAHDSALLDATTRYVRLIQDQGTAT